MHYLLEPETEVKERQYVQYKQNKIDGSLRIFTDETFRVSRFRCNESQNTYAPVQKIYICIFLETKYTAICHSLS